MAKRKASGSHESEMAGPIDVTFGAFEVGQYKVPYMSAIMRCQQVAEYFNLVTEDEKYALQDWTIDELFQREVDQSRVINIAENYLNPLRQNKPRFFNGLTIVLRPNDERQEAGKALEDPDYENQIHIGPVCIGIDSEWLSEDGLPRPLAPGVLRWMRDKVHAVAIDGQHRLAALKHLWEKDKNAARKIHLSVLMLLIDDRVGFSAPNFKREDSLRFMRSIFIDLNKHAVKVSRARNLLLDDTSVEAVFLRALLGSSLAYEQTEKKSPSGIPIGMDGEFETTLALNLVDWHSEAKSKVDEGPYVTSVLALSWVVNTLLSQDSSSKSRALILKVHELSPDDEKYEKKLTTALNAWPKSARARLSNKLQECLDKGLPFSLEPEDLELLQKEFSEDWGRPVVRLLTCLFPYRELAVRRIQANSLTPAFGQWYQAATMHETFKDASEGVASHYLERKQDVETALANKGFNIGRFRDHVKEINDDIKPQSVFYLLVGQRALFHALSKIALLDCASDLDRDLQVGLKRFSDCHRDFYAFLLIEALNHFNRADPGIFAKEAEVSREKIDGAGQVSARFWAGSIMKKENHVSADFSEAAAKRASCWLDLMTILFWFSKKFPNVTEKKVVIDACSSVQSLDEYGVLGKQLRRALILARGASRYPNDAPCTFLFTSTEIAGDFLVESALRSRVKRLCDVLWS